MKTWIVGWVTSAFPWAAAFADPPPVATARSLPNAPIIEVRDGNRFINFDLILMNRSADTLRLAKIEVSVYDAAHALVQRRALNTDAFAPSIGVIGNQILAPGQSLDVFNPFPEFDARMPLKQLEYSFCLQKESGDAQRERNRHRLPDDCDYHVETSVTPRFYDTKTPLILPLEGKVFVWEAHDVYAHHLRIPFSDPRVKALGIVANSNSFAADFIYTDDQGHQYHGDPQRIENWYSYGKPVYAPGAGRVIGTANDIPDNGFEDEQATQIGHPKLAVGKDPNDIGNFVLIDHGNGEFSLLIHMKPGSVQVKAGEHVRAGQQVGRIGFAGDAIFPHLHYSLMEGPRITQDWGIPAYFSNFRKVYGGTSVEIERGPVSSGEFVESNARY